MTYVSRTLVLLLAGLFMMSASAAADDRLTVTGGMDLRFLFLENYSQYDRNYTNATVGSPALSGQRGDEDSIGWVHQRYSLRFHVEAFENSKVVAQTFFDKQWGVGSATIGAYGGALAVEGFWIEGLIPGTAAKFELGVPYMAAESGGWAAANKILNTAIPGATIRTPLSDAIDTYTWFAWIGQDYDGYQSGGNGDDWALGTYATITLSEGLEADLIYAFHFADCGEAAKADQDARCTAQAHYGIGIPSVYEETRHWIGSTLRYQYADFSFSPTLIMYLADDQQAGDTESLLLDVRADYNIGPLSLSGRVVYTPGSDLNADGSKRSDRDYDVIGVWGIPLATQWFNLFGNTSGSPTFNDLGPLLLGGSAQGNIRHESFGLVHVAAKAEYTLTPQTTIGAAVGIFNTAEETVGTPSGASTFGGTAVDFAGVTYAGGSNLATEVDAWLHYQLYSNTTISFFVAYAMTGDALDLMMDGMVYESEDVMGAGGRFVYSF